MQKKIIALLLVFLLIIALSCSCGSSDKNISDKKLLTNEDCSLALRAFSDDEFLYYLEFGDMMADRASFDFYPIDDEAQWAYGIISEIEDNIHTASLIYPEYYEKYALQVNDCENFMIISARLLSGKFESDDIIWKTFSEEYGKVNTVYTDHDVDVSAKNHPPQRTAVWSKEINGIICEVETQQPDINDDTEYIKIIRLIDR